MKLLVFGKTGQIATELQAQTRDGIEIVNLSRHEADLYEPDVCAAIVAGTDADAVINAAAFTAVDLAESEPDMAMRVNGVAPTVMAQAAAARNLPFLHISTDYVFDGTGETPFSPLHLPHPLGVYGRTKFAGEEGVRSAGGRHAILRSSWVFSAHGNNFVKTMLRLSETREELNVVADQIGGPTPAADIAAALVQMARQMTGGHPGGTYHISGAPQASWSGFAREIFAQAGRNTKVNAISTAEYPTPAKRPLNSRLDCTTLQSEFGISQPDWKAGLARVLSELERGII